MQYNQLGRSGLTVSMVGLGCNNFGTRLDPERSADVVNAALDEGITFFDTADVYGASEEYLGEILGRRREDIVLATKFGSATKGRVAAEHEARGSRRYIKRAVEASLGRLQTDWIDLLQFHEPDPHTPLEETLSALDDLVRAGTVRYVGCSNVSAWQLVEGQLLAQLLRTSAGFVSVQNEYSLVDRSMEKDVLPVARKYGVGMIPFFPLANGLLSGKYSRGVAPSTGRLAEPGKAAYLRDELFDVVEALQLFAKERELSLVDVAIGGLGAVDGVSTVIAGATRPEQVRANAATTRWTPSNDDLAELDRITGDVGGVA